jgi:hypothetical protein
MVSRSGVCCGADMSRSPRLQSPDAREETVTKAADDYRSGLALIDQLGAFGLLDPALAGGAVTGQDRWHPHIRNTSTTRSLRIGPRAAMRSTSSPP